MKQFRDSDYWVKEDGSIFRYFPKRTLVTYPVVNGKKYKQEKIKSEMWKQLKPGTQSSGYKQVVLWKGYEKPTTFRVHRMVAECYLGPCPKNMEVDHIDGNRRNNHYTNLQYVTRQDNMAKRFISDSK